MCLTIGFLAVFTGGSGLMKLSAEASAAPGWTWRCGWLRVLAIGALLAAAGRLHGHAYRPGGKPDRDGWAQRIQAPARAGHPDGALVSTPGGANIAALRQADQQELTWPSKSWRCWSLPSSSSPW